MTNSAPSSAAREPHAWQLHRSLHQRKDALFAGAPAGEPVRRTSTESACHLLLNLYQMAMGSAMGDFDEQLFPLLREYIDFDAAWFGLSTLTPLGPVMHSNTCCSLSAEFLSDWEAVKRDDPMVPLVTERMGKPAVLSVADLQGPQNFWDFLCVRHGIAQVMCTVVADPALKIYTHLSLYRREALPRFSAHEIEVMEGVMPNLASAISMNRVHHIEQLRASTAKPRVARSVCDRRGLLQHADAEFADLMLMEWPDWGGAILPRALHANALLQAPTAYVGTHIALEIECVADLLLVQARPRSAIDVLTPKELTVARLFGEGQTYKAVAKRLGISPATVRHHLRKAYTKLNIQNKGEIAWLLSSENISGTV